MIDVDFPTGVLLKETQVRALDTLLEELHAQQFTGVIKYRNGGAGNLLIIDGEIRAATYGELGGDEALERMWNSIEGMLSVYTLEKDRAEFVLKWYTDIHGFGSVSSDILSHDVSVPVPEVEELIRMLEREGMSHLVRKQTQIERKAHKAPHEILQDVDVFLAGLFGDFMAENIVRSHLMKLHIRENEITSEDLALLAGEICKNVFQRVMDEKRAREESRKLKELLRQE